jgi:hypothetical protein
MLTNLRSGKSEDGKKGPLTGEDKKDSIEFWSERRLRIIYSLANCAISQKVRVLMKHFFLFMIQTHFCYLIVQIDRIFCI